MLRQGNGGYELQFIGPTVYETEEEADIDGVGVPLRAWHCVVCGNWIDSLILHHQTVTVLPDPGSKARTTIFNDSK
jgi:hypothetical protein